jgi:hypothetical protein
MKIASLSLLLCADAALGAILVKKSDLEKRQIGGTLAALAAGDTAILGALGSKLKSELDMKTTC